jgi:hypothetical protein
MHGRIVKQGSHVWLYVPEAHIYCNTFESSDKLLVVAAFRSDGYRTVDSGLIPMEEWCSNNFITLCEVEVEQRIIDFAVDSEKQRHAEVNDLEEFFRWAQKQTVEEALTEFLNMYGETPSITPKEEHEIGLLIRELIKTNIGGGLH